VWLPTSPRSMPAGAERDRDAFAVQPLVSVGLPVRNAERTLAVALASVLCQTFEDWELLVLDDYSQDSSRRIALEIAEADPRVRVLQPRGDEGLVPRLNQAVAAARGEYFARMDADDVAYPARFERQLEFLRANPSIDVVGTSVLVFRNHGIARGVRRAPPTHEAICARPSAGFKLFHPTWMGKAKWFLDHGYRNSARGWEDQELLLRAFRHSRLANLPEPLLGYREDTIHLRTVLRARANFARIVMKQEAARGRYGQAMGALLEQAAKAGAELTAVSLGMTFLLRNRARPASPDSIAEWQEVWSGTLKRARQLNPGPSTRDRTTCGGSAAHDR
jgi:glycosyltransferase involved in cell wall biosynthesis